jgi:predicted nucleic acid-binding protein
MSSLSGRRFSLDTNILVHAIDPNEPAKRDAAQAIISAASGLDCWLANQALAEFFSVATRKLGEAPAVAHQAARDWASTFPEIVTSRRAIDRAMAVFATGQFSFWDALMLAAAEAAGCTIMLSEDMGDGAELGAIAVRNPFGPEGLSAAARELLEIA